MSTESDSRGRRYTGRVGLTVTCLLAAVGLVHVLFTANAFSWLAMHTPFKWLLISEPRFLVLHLFLIVPVAFLLFPATKNAPTNRLPWYDAVAIGLCLLGHGYNFVFYTPIAFRLQGALINTFDLVNALVMLALICEASRRTMGPAMVIIAVAFFLQPLFADHMPAFLATKSQSLDRIVRVGVLGHSGIYGDLIEVVAAIIFIFLLFGQLMQRSGAGEFLVDLALRFFGRLTGGPALAAVGASALLGSVQNSSSANVATVGIITIPLMKSIGYSPKFAAAVEAAASNGGTIMPPVMAGVTFIMADLLEIPYWSICVAAFIPAILYYLSVGLMVYLEARKTGMQAVPVSKIRPLGKTLAAGSQFLLPLAVLIYFLAILGWRPQTACVWAIVTLIAVSMFRKETRLGFGRILASLRDSVVTVVPLTCLFALAGVLVGSMEVTGVGVRISSALIIMAGGNVFVLLVLTAIACLILGMPLNISAAYIVLVILVAPAVAMLGVPLLAVHMFIFYFATLGPITPPSCSCAFVAAGIAGKGAPPFGVGWMALRLASVSLIVPFTFMYNPVLLLQGAPLEIAIGALTAILGVTALAIGLQGWLIGKLNWLQRTMFLATAVMMIWPSWQADVVGAALGTAAVGYHLFAGGRKRELVPTANDGGRND